MTNQKLRGIGSTGSNLKFILLFCVAVQLVTLTNAAQKQLSASSEENEESDQIEVLNVDGVGMGDKMGKNVEVRGVLEGLFGKNNNNGRGSNEWDNRERGYGGYDGRRPNDRRNNGPCIIVRDERRKDDDDRHHHHHRHGK